MHVIRNTEEIRKFIGEKKTAVALGAFDGLHIGHYKVIRTAVESGLTPVVFTFRDIHILHFQSDLKKRLVPHPT